MVASFQFVLVSPEAEVLRVAAHEVSAPGTEGDFGVRVGHMPLVASLRPGVLSVEPADGTPSRWFVAGGFANVNGEACTVLAEQAVNVATLDVSAIKAEIERSEARLQLPNDNVTAATLKAELDLARERLKAATLAKAA